MLRDSGEEPTLRRTDDDSADCRAVSTQLERQRVGAVAQGGEVDLRRR